MLFTQWQKHRASLVRIGTLNDFGENPHINRMLRSSDVGAMPARLLISKEKLRSLSGFRVAVETPFTFLSQVTTATTQEEEGRNASVTALAREGT